MHADLGGSHQPEACACFKALSARLAPVRELGMDQRYAQVSLLSCPVCSQIWLRYHLEDEAFTASGRWYLGALTPLQASSMDAQNAQAALEGLEWYFYGGSYYGGRSGKTSGPVR